MRARLMCRTGELSGNTHDVSSDLVIGRDNESGVVIQSGLISGRHACIRKDSKGFVLEDLGSANGTWLDGERVVQPVRLDHLNVITLAQAFDFIFHVDDSAPVAQRSVSTPSVRAPAPPSAPPSARPSAPPSAPPIATPIAPPPTRVPTPPFGGDTIDLHGAIGGTEGRTLVMDFAAFGLPKLEPKAPIVFCLDVSVPDSPNQTIELVHHKRYMIGRASDCDIPIQEKHVSEHHATLMVGDTVMLEDAGSSNGTKVNGLLIQTATEILPGTTVTLGLAVTLRLRRP